MQSRVISRTLSNTLYTLIECRTFAVIRKRFSKVNNLTDLFENVKIDDIPSSWERQSCTKKYDCVKLINLVQTDEILLIEKITYLNIRFGIFGWIYICIHGQNLALNDLQMMMCHKTQTTNQPTLWRDAICIL